MSATVRRSRTHSTTEMTMRTAALAGAGLLVALGLGACASEDEPKPAQQNENLTQSSAGDYYVVTRLDFRECTFPACGGLYVRALNQAETQCGDGSVADECYVASINLSNLGLNDADRATLRQSVEAGHAIVGGKQIAPAASIGDEQPAILAVDEAWVGATRTDDLGTVFQVATSGIYCIQAPCPNFDSVALNTGQSQLVTGVDFSALELSDEELQRAQDQLWQHRIIVAGSIGEDLAGGQEIDAAEIYIQVQASEPTDPTGELCLDDAECAAGETCDRSTCLSWPCEPNMICTALCYGECVPSPPECPTCEDFCNPDSEVEWNPDCPLAGCNCGGDEPPPPPDVVNSCVGACGGLSLDETCWCDFLCEITDDPVGDECCGDFQAVCQ